MKRIHFHLIQAEGNPSPKTTISTIKVADKIDSTVKPKHSNRRSLG
jgi:hypothetical protein